MTRFYDDKSFGAMRQINMAGIADVAVGSARSAAVVVNRKTMMANVTIKDFNIEVLAGATCTGTGSMPTEVYTFTLNKSKAGTGALEALGTGTIGTGAQGAANGSILDCAVTSGTAAQLAIGDDLIFQANIGTSLGDASVQVRANVAYVERYVVD